jgi:probable HAF family extracellular repeat protein
MKTWIFSLVSAALWLGALSPARADYSFTTLDVPGASQTFGRGINDTGQVVGQFFNGASHGFRLSQGTFTPIDFPGATVTVAHGINKAGQMVGIFNSGTQHGFLRDGNGAFSVIDVPNATFNEARGINTAGQIAGWFQDAAGKTHGYLFSGGSFTAFDDVNIPGATSTQFFGINDSGQMVGTANVAGPGGAAHGVLFSGNAFTTIDVPGAAATFVNAINNAGQMAGTFLDPPPVQRGHGFFRDANGNFKTIDPPGSRNTDVRGLNSAGDVVGFFSDGTGVHGFVAKSASGCSSQVTVNSFTGLVKNPGFRVVAAELPEQTTGLSLPQLFLLTLDGSNGTLLKDIKRKPGTTLDCNDDKQCEPGIIFDADVTIDDGDIPVNDIHLAFIQNVTGWNGNLLYSPGPNLVAVVNGAGLPLLDTDSGGPPPVFYDFVENPKMGSARTVTAQDSPSLKNIVLKNPPRGPELQGVSVSNTFTMYLGCYDEEDPAFRTVAALDWSVLYSGFMTHHPLDFVPSVSSGIDVQPFRADTTPPVQVGPAASDVLDFVPDAP